MSKKNFLSNKFKIFATLFFMLFMLALLPLGSVLFAEAKSVSAEEKTSVKVKEEENALLSSNGAGTLYIDPESKYGGADTNDGLSADTPIKTLDKAKELASPTASIYIMSTFYITTDTVIDMGSSDIAFKRWKPEDPTIFESEEWYIDAVTVFEGDIFVVGSESDASISPTVAFDNFTFDGEEINLSANQDDRGYTEAIRVYNSKVILEENLSFIYFRTRYSCVAVTDGFLAINSSKFISKSGGGPPISLVRSEMVINDILMKNCSSSSGQIIRLENSQLTVNDGIFDGSHDASNLRTVIYSTGRNRIVINGGEFCNYKNYTIIQTSWHPYNFDASTSTLIINGGHFHDNIITNLVHELDSDYNPANVSPIIYGDGNIIINGGVFENNSNVNAGGVINMYQGNLTINGGVFRNNTAACGGVIYCNLVQNAEGTRTANLVIRNAEFINNSAEGGFTPGESFNLDYGNGETFVSGGAIFSTQPLTIDNCVFDGNSIQADIDSNLTRDCSGGAIYVKAIAQVINSSFSNNTTPRNRDVGVGIYTQGGAIAFVSGGVIQNCSFIGNGIGPHNGGALYLGTTATYIDNCYFEKNIASAYGGAIFGNATFTNCDFIRNKAESIGGVAMLVSGGARFDNCVMEENVSLSCSALLLEAACTITNCIIRNNVTTITDSASSGYKESKGAVGDCAASYDWNKLFLIGKNQIYGNKNSAELDEEGYPIIENGELIGGTEYNILVAFNWKNGGFYFNGLQRGGSTLGISFSGEQNADILNGIEPAIYFGEGSPINSEILDCLVSDDPNYEFELRDGAIYLKQVGGITGSIVYTASDTYVPYDGKEHGIDISIVAPTNAKIRYKTSEEESYSDSEPKFVNIGSYMVYFEISASGYTTVEGSRKVEITQNNTRLVDYVPNSNNVNAPITTIHLYYGETLAVGADLTGRISPGAIKDQNGNSVAGTFTANGTYNITFDTENIEVTFIPTNTEAYEGCTFTAQVEFKYDELYFINGAFYLNSDGQGVSIPASVGINKVLSYMTPRGAIYFSDTYDVTGEETIAVDKLVYLYRYKWRTSGVADEQVFNGEIFNITSSGSLSIGGGNITDKTHMTGKLIIDGQGYATAGSTSPLIVNNGTLTITGNVEIKGGYNTNTIGPVSPGGAIYNGGTASLYGVVVRDCRYLNYLASTQFNGAGGGIFNASTGTLNMVGGRINNCLARGGGAIYSEGRLSVINTTFISNSAYSGAQVGTSSSSGLTIKLANGEANLVNILINKSRLSNGTNYYTNSSSNMTAEKLGGGIYVGRNAKLTLVSSNLTQCYAYQGGGVYVDGTAYIFDTIIAACQAVNGGEGIAVGSQGRLTTVNIFISRCTSSNTPDASLGTNENGILTLTGGNTSLLSLSFEPGEAGTVISKTDDTRNKDYILGVVLALIVLGALVSFIAYLRTKTKKSKRE